MKKSSEYIPAKRGKPEADEDVAHRIARHLVDLLGTVPATGEAAAADPGLRARAVAKAAAQKAALAAGTLALPPGPLGWLTIVPELLAIWRIQAQMVADIAGVYGVSARLTREQMLYCLFRHAAAQAVRDLVIRVGGRLIAQDVPLRVFERVAHAIGMRVTRRLVGGGISRWLPVVGAVGVGAYAWYDTRQVARTAVSLFAMGRRSDVDAMLDALDAVAPPLPTTPTSEAAVEESPEPPKPRRTRRS